MPSANPPAASSVARKFLFHRIPKALEAVIPQKVVVTAAQAPNTTDVTSWFGTCWHFYLVGSSTYAAQFCVDVNGYFTLFVYNEVDDPCFYSVLDQQNGVLFLGADANGAPYLSFPDDGSGTETIVDGCGLGGGGTTPHVYTYAWYIEEYNPDGTAWIFRNSDYGSPFNAFLFQSGPLSATAVQAAASSVANRLKKFARIFPVRQ